MPDRIIRESICSSETINQLSWFEEVFFQRLIVNCDDFGRFDARPMILKHRLFPLKDSITDKTISEALSKLSTVGLVTLYVCEGKPYLQLVTWEKYQRTRATKSKFPDPPSIAVNCQQTPSNAPVFESESDNRNAICDKRESISESAPARHKRGQYGWVLLTDEEYQKLLSELGQTEVERCITYIDESAQSSGNKNKWKDWNLVIRKCSRDGWGLKNQQKPGRLDALAKARRESVGQNRDTGCADADIVILDERQNTTER